MQEIALCRRKISDSRSKRRKPQGPVPWRIIPQSFRMLQYYVRQDPQPDGAWSPILLCRPAALSIHAQAYVPRETPAFHTRKQAAFREPFFFRQKTASLRASGARAERLFFVCGDPGYFPRNPRLCFLLEFVADLEYVIYAFPFPRITGGAKQKRDRVLF